MKSNRNMPVKTIFYSIPALILLFVAIILPVGTTLGKYSKELDSLTFDNTFPLTQEIFDNFTTNDPPDTNNRPGMEEETPTTIYQVQSGDTLSSIAEKFHTTVEALLAFNHMDNADCLQVGMILHIPPKDYVVPELDEETNSTKMTSNIESD